MRAARLCTALSLLAVWALLLSYFRPSLLLLDTMTAGGDTPSFHHPIEHLRDVLLPAGNPQGWDPGNFGGYTPYQFYFLPPSLAVIALSAIVPFNVAFKLVTVAGTFLLPLATVVALRALGYRFPIPAVGAAASLLFLFNEGNSMWGGNIPSTLAGEFSFSLSFALSIAFTGLLYRGIHEGRWRPGLAVLLALIGLCHPLPLINAGTAGLFFLFDTRRFRRHLAYLAWVYGGAALLMAFWLLPLTARLPWSTPLHFAWQFQTWRELLPPILVPVAVLAVADVVRLAWRARRRAGIAGESGPAPYLLFCFLVSVVAFCNAPVLQVPDIRFIPFAQVSLLLLALDLLAAVLPGLPLPALPGLALVAGLIGCVQLSVGYVPDWIRWNYEGIERKRAYGVLQQITGALKGRLEDPRVAYEHSPAHEPFGSMRIFESLPRLAGRATLEGVLLQTAVTSPFVYTIQSLVSEQGTHVIPGYPYPMCDPVRGTARLDLFNVRDFVAVSAKVKGALDRDPRWTRRLTAESWAVYRRAGASFPYVRVPRYQPVRLETHDWKKDFHRWFASDADLEVPLVRAEDVPAADQDRFPLASRSPTGLPRVPLRSDCVVDERLSSLAIEFTTTCPGVPHWISMAYNPGWHVEGAARVYLVSPAFMLVIPDGPSVRLRFGRTAVDWAGLVGSLLGIGLCVAMTRPRFAAGPEAAPAPGSVSAPAPALRWAMAVVLAVVVGLTGWNLARTFGSQYFYRRGWAALDRQDYAGARREFERSLFFGRGTASAADAMFFRASSLFRAGDCPAAQSAFADLVARAPDGFWAAESLYDVGLCQQRTGRSAEAATTFRKVRADYPATVWASPAAERLRELEAAPSAAPQP